MIPGDSSSLLNSPQARSRSRAGRRPPTELTSPPPPGRPTTWSSHHLATASRTSLLGREWRTALRFLPTHILPPYVIPSSTFDRPDPDICPYTLSPRVRPSLEKAVEGRADIRAIFLRLVEEPGGSDGASPVRAAGVARIGGVSRHGVASGTRAGSPEFRPGGVVLGRWLGWRWAAAEAGGGGSRWGIERRVDEARYSGVWRGGPAEGWRVCVRGRDGCGWLASSDRVAGEWLLRKASRRGSRVARGGGMVWLEGEGWLPRQDWRCWLCWLRCWFLERI
ncbi:uncharacterized protein A4U43_C08F11630 [Asparagus officinalis]|nr:uncharacterized protein A4U43_C08F11630 [Asparagus officinalis]